MDPAEVVAMALELVGEGDADGARSCIAEHYPHTAAANAGRRYTATQCMHVYLRDGFIDRLSGKRLINPAALRYLSARLPDVFPAHPNWKQSESHFGFWELFPTIEHLVPVARGGADERNNWVTTSMLTNGAKGNALIEELGWILRPPGDRDWDGMTSWLIETVGSGSIMTGVSELAVARHSRYIMTWTRASVRASANPLEG